MSNDHDSTTESPAGRGPSGVPVHPLLGDRGATAIEYALIAALIAAIIVGVVTNVGQDALDNFTQADF